MEWRGNVVPCIRGGQCVRGWLGNVVPCIRRGQSSRWSGVETWFLVATVRTAHGGVAWKLGTLYPGRAMRSVEWRGNVVPFIRGGQCFRWSGVERWFLLFAEGNALSEFAWKRVSLYPRWTKLSVDWHGNVVPCIRGGQCSPWIGVKTCFPVSVKGNALGVLAWKLGSLYPRRAMRSVEWRGNVVPCIRGGHCSWNCGVESVSLYARRAMRSEYWRGKLVPCIRGGQCARCSGVETWFLLSEGGNTHSRVAW